jgi:hypothetical protein
MRSQRRVRVLLLAVCATVFLILYLTVGSPLHMVSTGGPRNDLQVFTFDGLKANS